MKKVLYIWVLSLILGMGLTGCSDTKEDTRYLTNVPLSPVDYGIFLAEQETAVQEAVVKALVDQNIKEIDTAKDVIESARNKIGSAMPVENMRLEMNETLESIDSAEEKLISGRDSITKEDSGKIKDAFWGGSSTAED